MAQEGRALLRRVGLFSALPEEALEVLAPHLRRRTYRRDTMIFHRDQAGDALYIVGEGHVRIFLPGEEGAELTVDLAGPGDVFGELALLDGGARSASAEAVEDAVLYTLTREAFLRALETTPGLAVRLIELLGARLRHVTAYAESLAFLDVQARLARILLDLADRHARGRDGQTVEIGVDLTQSELASMVGATRERVNRALGALRSQGLVALRGRRIFLLDPLRLRQRAGPTAG